jgi:tetratricopeptide (TPR) repeat protein
LLSPLLFLLLLEGGLALTGWIEPVRLLKQVEHNGERFWTTNPRYGRQIFQRRAAPLPSHAWVSAEKDPDRKRVVVIGESAAAGFPSPDFSVARIMDAVWEIHAPHVPADFVNLTMTGINSHYLRRFMREAEVLNPDLIILYAGHNEVIGPFGPASIFGEYGHSVPVVRLLIALRHSRIGQGVVRIIKRFDGQDDGLPPWGGLDEFMELALFPGDPALEKMYRQSRSNFRAMLQRAARKRVPVLVVNPAVNLTDWPPLRSHYPSVPDATALESFRAGNPAAISSAWQAYRLAQRLHKEGEWNEKWKLYRLALDLDGARFRADSRMMDILKGLAESMSARGISWADADQFLHEGNPAFASDQEYFYEHVHLTFRGKQQVALSLLNPLAELWGVRIAHEAAADLDALADRLLYTELEQAQAQRQIRSFYAYDVFANQVDADARKADMDQRLNELNSRIAETWTTERLQQRYMRARLARPRDEVVHFVAGRLFSSLQDYRRAGLAIAEGLGRNPSYSAAYLHLARIRIIESRIEEAESLLDILQDQVPEFPGTARLRGQILAQRGQVEAAILEFEQAVQEQPFDHVTLVNLGMAYQVMGRDLDAIRLFRRSLDLNAVDAAVLNNSAWLIATSRQIPDVQRHWAVTYAEDAIQLNPAMHRYWGTLAVAYAANRDQARAKEVGGNAVQRALDAGDVEAVTALLDELSRLGIEL